MTWFKVDDDLAFHRKTVAAGNAAMGLWVRAGSWCGQQLNDGHVPHSIARRLGTKTQANALVRVGLWHAVDGGYQFHQWDSDGDGTRRNFTKAEVEDKRRKRADAGRLGGQVSKSQANASNTVDPPSQVPSPVPSPVPSRSSVVKVCRLLSVGDRARQPSDDDTTINDWRRRYPSVDIESEAAAWLTHNNHTVSHLRRPRAAWVGWLRRASERSQPTPTPPPLHALCDHGRDGRTCPFCRRESA